MGARRFTRGWMLATLLPLVACVALPAHAGAAAGTSMPARDEQAVELVSAFLHETVDAESTRVECVYVLRNRGDSTSVRLPFPATLVERNGVPWTGLFRSIRSFVDGTPVWPHTAADTSDDRPGGDFMRWYLEPVPFAAHQTRCVRDVYGGDYLMISRSGSGIAHAGGGSSTASVGDIGEDLFPGRRWAGPIGTCDVVLTLDILRADDEVVQALPAAVSHDGHEWRWHFDGALPGTPALPWVAVFWRRRSDSPAR